MNPTGFSHVEVWTTETCAAGASTSLRRWMRLLVFLITTALPVSADQFGDFTYTNNGSHATITGYTGSGGAVVIPADIVGLPVQSIQSSAFAGQSTVTRIDIPASITTIGANPFARCTGLLEINVNTANSKYGSQDGVLFNKAKTTLIQYPTGKLGAYVIPNSVTSVASAAFSSAAGLTNVTIPSSVTSIGISAFANCTRLTQVAIPSSVTRIASLVFSNCTGLTSVTIPSSVTNIDSYAFQSCPSLAGIAIPSSVTNIGTAAFSNCTGLTTVTLPPSITLIDNYTFQYCTSLTSVTIPSSVTQIKIAAFSHCAGLTNLAIPASVTDIGDSAFSNCAGLISITIPSGVTAIGSFAFSRCDELTEILVDGTNPNFSSSGGVLFNKAQTVLEAYPCGKEGAYLIPSTITSLSEGAFSNCTSLTSVAIPPSVTSIGSSTFDGCSGLTVINIPPGVTSIGSWAFRNCTGLRSVAIPSSVTSIDYGPFSRCTLMTEILVDEGNLNFSSVGGVLFNKTQTALVQYPGGKAGAYAIPSTVVTLQPYAFAACVSLTGITIPTGVRSIGPSSFRDCTGLTSVTFPPSLLIVDNSAFARCSLESATFLGNSPQLIQSTELPLSQWHPFYGNAAGFTFYFYQGAAGFSSPTWYSYPAAEVVPGSVESYSTWASNHFSAAELADPLMSGPAGDANRDGVVNLLHYAFNIPPFQNGQTPLVSGTGTSGSPSFHVTEAGSRRLILEYVRRKASSSPGLSYIPQVSINLDTWSQMTGSKTVVPINGTWERVIIEDDAEELPSRFGRVQVSSGL